jgi:hypothetical protein
VLHETIPLRLLDGVVPQLHRTSNLGHTNISVELSAPKEQLFVFRQLKQIASELSTNTHTLHTKRHQIIKSQYSYHTYINSFHKTQTIQYDAINDHKRRTQRCMMMMMMMRMMTVMMMILYMIDIDNVQ